MLDTLKKDFPIFKTNPKLVYLDSTATSLKPKMVLDAIDAYYKEYSANVFRGLYSLSEKATEKYESIREKVAHFINAPSAEEIIFVRNATEAVNLVAYSWGRLSINKSDEIVTTIMEHHSNFVPWQQLAFENGAVLKIIGINQEGLLDKEALIRAISRKTKLVAITHISNVLGTINPIKEIVEKIKRINPNCLVFVDGAQAVPHLRVDVQNLKCDFYCFSAHKMLGPTGVGVLWGRKKILEEMTPFNFGGEMIEKVTLTRTDFKKAPYKFEAGTPHIAGVIGLGSAIDYLTSVGMDKIRKHEEEITRYALEKLLEFKDLIIYGPKIAKQRCGVIAFTLKGVHPHDIAQILDDNHICIRSGNHCAMPLHSFLGLLATSRVSFYLYNTKEDVDKLIMGLTKVHNIFKQK